MTTTKKTTTKKTTVKTVKAKASSIPIPTLPTNPFVYEVFNAASKQRSKAKKVEVLKRYAHDSIMTVLIWNFDETAISVLPFVIIEPSATTCKILPPVIVDFALVTALLDNISVSTIPSGNPPTGIPVITPVDPFNTIGINLPPKQ